MKTALQIVVLAENTAAGRGIRGEHGLAFLVERDGQHLLFDTGQGLVLADNAKVLNLDLTCLDAIVLSHGHYDHTGGLAQVLECASRPLPVHAHPGAVAPKYRAKASGIYAIGMPEACLRAARGSAARLMLSTDAVAILPGVRMTGEIPRIHDEERSQEHFCLDAEGRQDDPVADDQALIVETATGIVVLLGCAHAGVINTLDHIRGLTGGAPIRAVVGGMHLRSATPERLAWTIRELRRFDIAALYPMHCTGFAATAALWQALPGRVQSAGAGAILTFD
ncbi:MAG: MBL fold metallo-hydrolase [Lentisphaerae bacterium]|nr:MBL fold metallo-hydrolase [Lentisphaerota bacterium]